MAEAEEAGKLHLKIPGLLERPSPRHILSDFSIDIPPTCVLYSFGHEAFVYGHAGWGPKAVE